MGLSVRMAPEAGGRLLLDGETYDPRIPYPAGTVVRVMALPQGSHQFAGWSGDVPPGHEDDMPLEITISGRPQEVVANFGSGVRHAAELSLDAGFENGNGILRYLQRDSRGLVIEPVQVNASNNIWWHFKIHGITPGEFVRIDVVHCPIAGNCNPVYSYDGVNWQRFSGTRPPFIQKFTAPSVEISRNIPYTYSRTLALAAEMSGPHVQVLDLAISEEGRPVKMMRFTDPDVADTGKRIIWIMARQHAFESHSSWYAEGFCRWLHGDSAEAAALRRRAVVYVTPIVDVDNVYHGGAGKEQLTRDGRRADFNRRWDRNSPWAAIRAAQRLLEDLRRAHDIAAIVDLHSPWYHEEPHWHIPNEYGGEVTRFADLWSRALEATGSGIRWKHWLRVHPPASLDSSEPTMGMVSAMAYGARLIGESRGHLCFTIETPHWHDGYGNPITIEALYAYGEALGRALASFLGG